MPRKSAAELAFTKPQPRSSPMRPPPTLSQPEAALFKQLVADCLPGFFKDSDAPLLARYCEAAILAERSTAELRRAPVTDDGRPSPWLYVREKAVREMVALSLRLKLSPQSRKSPRHPSETTGGHGVGFWQTREWDNDTDNLDK
jgi:phage terminase small subunit